MNNMLKIKKIDEFIYFLLCCYAITSCINQSLSYFCMIVGFALGIVRWGIKRPQFAVSAHYKKPLLWFLVVFFFLAFISGDIRMGLSQYWWIFTSISPFFMITLFVQEKNKVKNIFYLLLCSMFVNICYAIGVNINQLFQHPFSGRATGFDDMIVFAGRLLIFIPIMSILLIKENNVKREILISMLLVLSLLALILNGTRIVWLIIPIVLLFLVSISLDDIKKVITVFLLAAIFSVGIIYTITPIQQKFISMIDISHSSTKGHYFIARDAILIIKDNPIFGIGLGQFKKLYNEKYKSNEVIEVEHDGTVFHAHNNTLMIMTETGIVGLIFFWFMFGSFIFYPFKRWRKLRDSASLMAFTITVTLMLQGVTDYSFGLRPVMMNYFCILGIYLISINDNLL